MLVQVNEAKLRELCSEAKTFVQNVEAQEALAEAVQAQKTITKIVDDLKKSLKESMIEEKLEFVESDKVKVVIYKSGARWKLVDETKTPPELMKIALDSGAVEAWIENGNDLPEGIKESNQSTAIRIDVK